MNLKGGANSKFSYKVDVTITRPNYEAKLNRPRPIYYIVTRQYNYDYFLKLAFHHYRLLIKSSEDNNSL